MSHLNLPLPSSFLPFLLPFLLLGPGWDMFWTPLGIVGTSLGPDLGFGVVYLRILWDLFGISVGHVGRCWDMFGDCSDLDQKSMKKHSRSQITTVVIREF